MDRDKLRTPFDRHATLTSLSANLWVVAEICGSNITAFSNWLLGASPKTDLWTFITAFEKSWYPVIWATFQEGVGYRSFARRL